MPSELSVPYHMLFKTTNKCPEWILKQVLVIVLMLFYTKLHLCEPSWEQPIDLQLITAHRVKYGLVT